MTAPATLKKADVAKALDAAQEHGLTVHEYICDFKAGTVRVIAGTREETGPKRGFDHMEFKP